MSDQTSNQVYEKAGNSGPALVLLHGWGQSLQSVKPLSSLLSQHYQVFSFDLPGFGKAPPPPAAWSSFEYADYINDAMKKLGISSYTVAGHSFGGKVAMSMAVKYPSAVESLVLLAASGLKRKRSLAQRIKSRSIKVLATLIKACDRTFDTNFFITFFIPRFGSKDYKNAGLLRPILVKTVNEDFTPHLKNITCPTLLLWGENDQETPVDMAYALRDHITCATLIVFAHKDHYLLNDCGYHLCAEYMKDFLRKSYG